MEITASISFRLKPDGSRDFSFVGPPLELDTFWYGILEAAKDQVRTAVAQKELAKIQPPGARELLEFGSRR